MSVGVGVCEGLDEREDERVRETDFVPLGIGDMAGDPVSAGDLVED